MPSGEPAAPEDDDSTDSGGTASSSDAPPNDDGTKPGAEDGAARLPTQIFAVGLIAVGVLLNFWFLEYSLAPGRHIPPFLRWLLYVVIVVQVVIVLLGVRRLRRGPADGVKAYRAWALAGLVWVIALPMAYTNAKVVRIIDPDKRVREVVAELVKMEGLITELTPRLKTVAKDIANLSLPGEDGADVFSESVVVVDLEGALPAEAHKTIESIDWTEYKWKIAQAPETRKRGALALWKPMFDAVDYIDHAKLKIKLGHFVSETELQTLVAFSALAHDGTGKMVGFHAKANVTWTREGETWRITKWETIKFKSEHMATTPFREVTSALIEEPLFSDIRHNKHGDEVIQFIETKKRPTPEWQLAASDRTPGVSVVDINSDGFDDIYLYWRLGKNRLLVNQRGQGFVDEAAKYGLDFEDHTSSVLFADFDNDGDTDAVLGRTLARTLYLENDGTRFVDKTSEAGVTLPKHVSAISASDYDNDGLLDVYISTYAVFGVRRLFRGQPPASLVGGYLFKGLIGTNPLGGTLLAEDLPPHQSERLFEVAWEHVDTAATHWVGPPNVLLRNLGGNKFETSEAIPDVYRSTYAASWADYDNDGDKDLYLANDYSPNNLFRNDDGKLVDVTAETGTQDIGFGMGVTWGDYDEDGRQDLYVANMYSTAGRRVTSFLEERLDGKLEDRFGRMARGNTLFRNAGDKFDHVSGLDEGTVQVEGGGWAWSSQFFDVDNDGDLDIYSPSGYYTAPKKFELPEDL